MATATINNTAWVGAEGSPYEGQLAVQPFGVPRPRGAFLVTELMLLAVALLQTVLVGNTHGVFLPIAICALFFHVNGLDKSILSSKALNFWFDLFESVLLGGLASALISRILPSLSPPADLAIAATLITGLLPVILRLFLQRLVTRGRFVEEILIVGSGDLPAKLRHALGRAGHSECHSQALSLPRSRWEQIGAVDFSELRELVARDRISRVVIAELDAQRRERLAAVLLDARLRGLQVDDAVEFYEEFSHKVWLEALSPRVVRLYEWIQSLSH